jgi:hypothetical protein
MIYGRSTGMKKGTRKVEEKERKSEMKTRQ